MARRGKYTTTSIKGINEVTRNMNKAVRKIKGVSLDGLITGALMVYAQTETVTPFTPLDLGNLRQSFFIATPNMDAMSSPKIDPDVGGSFKGPNAAEYNADHYETVEQSKALLPFDKPTIIFGYTVNYAAPVHELEERYAKVNWSRPGSGGKWFEIAIKRNTRKFLKIVRDKVKAELL